MSEARPPHYFRFHIGDYIRDTQGLSLLQHGAYLRLMLWYYSSGKPLPADLGRVYRSINALSEEEQAAVRFILEEFFLLDGNTWRHKRIETELYWWESYTGAQRDKIEKRWKNKEKVFTVVLPENYRSNTNQNQNQNQNQKNRKALSSPSDFDAAKRLLAFLNEKAGRAYKAVPSHLKMIQARLREHGEETLRAMVAMKCREWRTDEKMAEYLRPSTLFNATKCADYVGRVGTFEDQS